MGWAIHPEAFKDELLLLTRRYKLPVYVTENGCGHEGEKLDENGQLNDPYRIDYLTEYLKAMTDAINEGANVKGYFIWSLLDSYEWGSGYGNPFGVIHVDMETMDRTIKASGHWYAKAVKAGRIE